MPGLIQLLTLESDKLMMAASPHLKHRLKGRIRPDLMTGHLNNVFRLASMLQPLLKAADAHQTEALEEALRRIH